MGEWDLGEGLGFCRRRWSSLERLQGEQFAGGDGAAGGSAEEVRQHGGGESGAGAHDRDGLAIELGALRDVDGREQAFAGYLGGVAFVGGGLFAAVAEGGFHVANAGDEGGAASSAGSADACWSGPGSERSRVKMLFDDARAHGDGGEGDFEAHVVWSE